MSEQWSRFVDLFPSSSAKFAWDLRDLANVDAEWLLHGWEPDGRVHLHADDLLVRCASWRQDYSLFSAYSFLQLLWKFREEYHSMSGRKAKEVSYKRATWVGFLDFRLSEDELLALDDWQPTAAEIWESVDTLIESNYRLTLSYNERLKLASVTLIDDNPERRSGGYGLSSSDRDGALALKAAVFKHFHVLQGSWERLIDQPLTRGQRG